MSSDVSEHPAIELVFVRHGETVWNLENRIQGHQDSPLTVKGIAQAETLARRLSGERFDVLFSSDLGRAMHTAEIIGQTIHLKPSADSRLRERNLGIFQGYTYTEMQTRFPEEFAHFETWNPAWHIPEGESGEDLKERVSAFLAELNQRIPGGSRLCIVTHGGLLDILMRLALGLPLDIPRTFSLFNGSLNRFSLCGSRLRLLTWGDISHLAAVSGDDPTYAVKSL
ncbi:MAG: histidine phosphatase family protein [Candidatus Ozemobacteraceae bacterium]